MAQAAPQSMSLVMGDYLSSNDVLTASKFHRVIHHINDYSIMNTRKNLTLLYMFLIITFMGVNLGLLGTNFKSQNFIEENYYVPFHVLEFWAVFAFTITEAFLLVVTESLNWGSKLRCLLVFVNILGSLTAALIMSMDPEVYETDAHWVEYAMQIFITSVDFVFVLDVIKRKDTTNFFFKYRYAELTFAAVLVVVSVLQLCVYQGCLKTGIEHDRASHFFEFVTEFCNGGFALLYAAITYGDMQEKLKNHYEEMKSFA